MIKMNFLPTGLRIGYKYKQLNREKLKMSVKCVIIMLCQYACKPQKSACEPGRCSAIHACKVE